MQSYVPRNAFVNYPDKKIFTFPRQARRTEKLRYTIEYQYIKSIPHPILTDEVFQKVEIFTLPD